jgi:hypothetical protein
VGAVMAEMEQRCSQALSLARVAVNVAPLSFPDCYYSHYQHFINDAINHSIPGAAQLDFVRISKTAKSIGWNVRVSKPLLKLFFELLPQICPKLFHSFQAFSENSSS